MLAEICIRMANRRSATEPEEHRCVAKIKMGRVGGAPFQNSIPVSRLAVRQYIPMGGAGSPAIRKTSLMAHTGKRYRPEVPIQTAQPKKMYWSSSTA
jgi:hypothetical protein